jgi:hypothetical protein
MLAAVQARNARSKGAMPLFCLAHCQIGFVLYFASCRAAVRNPRIFFCGVGAAGTHAHAARFGSATTMNPSAGQFGFVL